MDMREVTPGSVIDGFHFDMWAGFLRVMLEKEEVRAEFEAETGASFPQSPKSGIDAMIDKACGYDRGAAQLAYLADFARWVTPLYFGGPEDICPAIAAKLAKDQPQESQAA